MDDNVKKTDVETGEEEYHFSETENVDPFGAKPKAASIFERINRRHILMAVGAIIVILSLYKLIGVLLTTTTTPQPPVITTPTVKTPKVITPIRPIVPNNKLRKQLSTMQAHDVAAKGQLQQVDDKLNVMTERMANLQDSLSAMSQQLQTISQGLEQQTRQIEALKVKRARPYYRKTRKRVTRPKLTYTIQAMIPGRAWIQSSAGTVLTVKKGDKLPGYGTITKISPVNGIITTRSGAIIRYKE